MVDDDDDDETKAAISIRELRRDENDAVVALIRSGLVGLTRDFRWKMALEPKMIVFLGIVVAVCALLQLFAASLVLLALFAAFVHQAPHMALAAYFSRCDDYADMHAYYRRDGHKLLVAVAGTRIVGSIAVATMDATSADLRRMSVHKDFRRRGIARRLVLRIEEHCRACGYERMELSTTTVQTAAIKLYESVGYRLVRTVFRPIFRALPLTGPTVVFYEKVL